MSHPASEELLDLALGTLPVPRRREIERHVASCDACAAAWKEVRLEQVALKKRFAAVPETRSLEEGILRSVPERRKTSLPWEIWMAAMVVAAALFFGVLGYIVFSAPGDRPQIARHRVELLESEARRLDAAGRFDAAIAKYREALALIEGNDYYKTKAMSIRATIRQIEQDQRLLVDANFEFEQLRAQFESARGDDEHHELLKRAKGLRDNYRDSTAIAWLPELNTMIERIEKVLDTSAAINKRLDFQVRRNEIFKESNLAGDPHKAQWGKAVSAWASYLEEDTSDLSRVKARNEVRVINARARDNFRRVKSRAMRLVDGNQKADAIDMLKKELERFRGTDSEKDLVKFLESLDL